MTKCFPRPPRAPFQALAALRASLGAILLSLTIAAALVLAPGAGMAQEAATEGEAAVEAGAEAAITDPARVLADILRDEAARDALIAELERAAELAEPEPVEEAVVEAATDEVSIGRQIALVTQGAAENIADAASLTWRRLQRAPALLSGFSGEEIPALVAAATDLLLVIAGTVLVFFGLRRAAVPIYRRMGASARGGSIARSVMMFSASGLMDVLIVILAWAAGYALALLAFGEFGEIALRQTLYLNAFLLVEMIKVGVRLLLSPASGSLRILPLQDEAAKYLSRWLNLLVGILGYGQLLVVPILNSEVSYAAGRAGTAVLGVLVLAIAIYLVLRNRQPVAHWMLGTQPGEPRKRGSVAFVARHWHWLALIYLAAMAITVLTRPARVVFDTFATSGQIALAVLVGVVVSSWLGRAMRKGVRLPEWVNERLPLLERRLNGFVPRALFLLRILIIIAVAAFALDAIGWLDVGGWLGSNMGLQFSGTVASVLLVLLASAAIWLGLNSWIDYRLNPSYGKVASAREQTLLTLLRNAATVALAVITLMFVLAEIGLDIAPLLASAGVLGLAIGFGAQKMVQDIITGIFIQFENAINVGDVITVGGITGEVEKLTIRSVSLRDLQGAYHIVPFSAVDLVTNYMRGFGYFLCEMGVAYRENVEEVKAAMFDAFEELRSDPEQAQKILEDFEWFGLNAFGDSAIVLRARIKCAPGTQWGVGRAYNAIVKRIFDERGIEIPFPHQTIYLGEAKDGATQTFKVSNVAAPAQIEAEEAPGGPAKHRGGTPTQDGPAEESS